MTNNQDIDDSVLNYLETQKDKKSSPQKQTPSTRQEPSAVYILAGLCSFIFPGLGQMLINRLIGAALCFISAILWWMVMLNFMQEAGSFIMVAILVSIMVIPNIVSAYLAANGHLKK